MVSQPEPAVNNTQGQVPAPPAREVAPKRPHNQHALDRSGDDILNLASELIPGTGRALPGRRFPAPLTLPARAEVQGNDCMSKTTSAK